jgi:hypothetical protein
LSFCCAQLNQRMHSSTSVALFKVYLHSLTNMSDFVPYGTRCCTAQHTKNWTNPIFVAKYLVSRIQQII